MKQASVGPRYAPFGGAHSAALQYIFKRELDKASRASDGAETNIIRDPRSYMFKPWVLKAWY